jgi:two-component sensor histidine kinase
MQVISSMLRLRSRTVEDKKLHSILQEINNKIQSMALVHKKLYESHNLSTLSLKSYFSDLISLVEQSYLVSRDSVKLIYRAEDVSVLIDTAIPLGLILIELLYNSIRHGFPQGQKGEIHIRLRKKPPNRIALEVQDNGKGLPQGFDVEKDGGLGLKTVMGLARDQLGGKVTFENQKGVKCRILIKEELHKPRV